MQKINYDFINKAELYYQRIGYQWFDLPWLAPINFQEMTSGISLDTLTPFNSKGAVVGSAEQCFLKAYFTTNLKNKSGNYVSTTPCFRNEKETAWNFNHFIKTELFCFGESSYSLERVIEDSLLLYGGLLTSQKMTVVSMGKDMWDININGVEVGSYGKRTLNYLGKTLSYVYGTGLAEPRFSMAVNTK